MPYNYLRSAYLVYLLRSPNTRTPATVDLRVGY